MFCLYTLSKLSSPKFEFSPKVMESNPGYILKSLLLYPDYFVYKLTNFSHTAAGELLFPCCGEQEIKQSLCTITSKFYLVSLNDHENKL